MLVQSRITRATSCDVINLTEAEKLHYAGSGWKLARFVNGCLVDFFDPMGIEYRDNVKSMTCVAIDNAVSWIAGNDGEVWLVMCSCYQLCHPRQVTLTDVSAIAYMARVFSEQFTEI